MSRWFLLSIGFVIGWIGTDVVFNRATKQSIAIMLLVLVVAYTVRMSILAVRGVKHL